MGSHCDYSSQAPKYLAFSECKNLTIDRNVALMHLQTIIHRSILYSIFKEKNVLYGLWFTVFQKTYKTEQLFTENIQTGW